MTSTIPRRITNSCRDSRTDDTEEDVSNVSRYRESNVVDVILDVFPSAQNIMKYDFHLKETSFDMLSVDTFILSMILLRTPHQFPLFSREYIGVLTGTQLSLRVLISSRCDVCTSPLIVIVNAGRVRRFKSAGSTSNDGFVDLSMRLPGHQYSRMSP